MSGISGEKLWSTLVDPYTGKLLEYVVIVPADQSDISRAQSQVVNQPFYERIIREKLIPGVPTDEELENQLRESRKLGIGGGKFALLGKGTLTIYTNGGIIVGYNTGICLDYKGNVQEIIGGENKDLELVKIDDITVGKYRGKVIFMICPKGDFAKWADIGRGLSRIWVLKKWMEIGKKYNLSV